MRCWGGKYYLNLLKLDVHKNLKPSFSCGCCTCTLFILDMSVSLSLLFSLFFTLVTGTELFLIHESAKSNKTFWPPVQKRPRLFGKTPKPSYGQPAPAGSFSCLIRLVCGWASIIQSGWSCLNMLCSSLGMSVYASWCCIFSYLGIPLLWLSHKGFGLHEDVVSL